MGRRNRRHVRKSSRSAAGLGNPQIKSHVTRNEDETAARYKSGSDSVLNSPTGGALESGSESKKKQAGSEASPPLTTGKGKRHGGLLPHRFSPSKKLSSEFTLCSESSSCQDSAVSSCDCISSCSTPSFETLSLESGCSGSGPLTRPGSARTPPENTKSIGLDSSDSSCAFSTQCGKARRSLLLPAVGVDSSVTRASSKTRRRRLNRKRNKLRQRQEQAMAEQKAVKCQEVESLSTSEVRGRADPENNMGSVPINTVEATGDHTSAPQAPGEESSEEPLDATLTQDHNSFEATEFGCEVPTGEVPEGEQVEHCVATPALSVEAGWANTSVIINDNLEHLNASNKTEINSLLNDCGEGENPIAIVELVDVGESGNTADIPSQLGEVSPLAGTDGCRVIWTGNDDDTRLGEDLLMASEKLELVDVLEAEDSSEGDLVIYEVKSDDEDQVNNNIGNIKGETSEAGDEEEGARDGETNDLDEPGPAARREDGAEDSSSPSPLQEVDTSESNSTVVAVTAETSVDAALAELDSIPDEVCESGDVEEEEEEEEEWSYYRMDPQTQPQSEDVLVPGSSAPLQDSELTDMDQDQKEHAAATENNGKVQSSRLEQFEELRGEEVQKMSSQELLAESSIETRKEAVGEPGDEPTDSVEVLHTLQSSPLEAAEPPVFDTIQTSMEHMPEADKVSNLMEASSDNIGNLLDNEPSSSPHAPGSPRSVEGFVTSVELNTPEESFGTNFPIHQQTQDMIGTGTEQPSGPFSVYVSSSPEPVSLDPLLQGSGEFNNASEMTNGQIENETESPQTGDFSPVEIVHAQSTVEVVAPPSPVENKDSDIFTIPDHVSDLQSSPKVAGGMNSDVTFIPEPVVEPSAEVPVPVYIEENTPVSEGEPEIQNDLPPGVPTAHETEETEYLSKHEAAGSETNLFFNLEKTEAPVSPVLEETLSPMSPVPATQSLEEPIETPASPVLEPTPASPVFEPTPASPVVEETPASPIFEPAPGLPIMIAYVEEIPTPMSPVSEPTPASPVSEPTPASPVSEPTPASPVSEPTPASPVLEPTPASPVLEPTPASPVLEPTPASPILEPTPASPVLEPTPASPVLEPTPASPVLEPTPASPVLEPTPASPVLEPTPAPPVVEETPAPVSPVLEKTPVSSVLEQTPVSPVLEPIPVSPVLEPTPVPESPAVPEMSEEVKAEPSLLDSDHIVHSSPIDKDEIVINESTVVIPVVAEKKAPEVVKSPTKTPKAPAKVTPDTRTGKTTPRPTPGKATPSRTPVAKTSATKAAEKKPAEKKPLMTRVTPKPSPSKPAAEKAATAKTTTQRTTSAGAASSRLTAAKPAPTKTAPKTTTTTRPSAASTKVPEKKAPKPAAPSATKVPSKPSTAGATTSKPSTTRPTPSTRPTTTTAATKRPVSAPAKKIEKPDSSKANAEAKPSQRSLASSRPATTSTTTRKPLSATTKPVPEKETKNTTNRILSTTAKLSPKPATGTARSATSKTTTAARTTDVKTAVKVNGTASTTTKSRVTTTTTKSSASKATGVAAKKTLASKTVTNKTKSATEAATAAGKGGKSKVIASPVVNGENKIAHEETSVEVVEKCVAEDVVLSESSHTVTTEQVINTETMEVIVNGDH